MAPKAVSKASDGDSAVGSKRGATEPHWLVESTRIKDVLQLILCVRILNAILLGTYFQPDEYYQALEPAWDLAFGEEAQAVITWEWTHELRSSLFPVILAGWYKFVDFICYILFPPLIRTKILLLAPQVFMVLPATVMDAYTWLFAEKIYGKRTPDGMALLGLLLFSPWQWLASVRTLSNTFETSISIVALYYWPWTWMTFNASPQERAADLKKLKYSLFLGAIACMVRPTNALVWLVLAAYSLPYANVNEFTVFLRDASIFGSAGIFVSAVSDWFYYESWTFPAFNFFYFNVSQDISSFYGSNRLDYYFTEGIPMLFFAATPFAIMGLYQSLTGQYPTIKRSDGTLAPMPPTTVMRGLAVVSLLTPLALSFIPHKEARFIYPVFPILSILAARPMAAFFKPLPSPSTGLKRILLRGMIAVHILIAIYLGSIHNRGVMNVMGFLREEFEKQNPQISDLGVTTNLTEMTFGTFMPCHSTPHRSHLVYPEISGWSLSCQPPIDVPEDERTAYKDVADKFYDDPVQWMRYHFGSRKLIWPDYIIFYEHLEPYMNETIVSGGFEECYRTFNSIYHEDWRRKGDIVVWCKQHKTGSPDAGPRTH